MTQLYHTNYVPINGGFLIYHTSTPTQTNLQRQFNSFNQIPQQCGPQQVCCRRPVRQPQFAQPGQCGKRNTNGITGRIKNPVYVDGDSEFGKYR